MMGAHGYPARRSSGYGGPCPPSGTHRYAFTLFALSERTGLADGFAVDELRAAIEGHLLGSTTLTGTYSRGA